MIVHKIKTSKRFLRKFHRNALHIQHLYGSTSFFKSFYYILVLILVITQIFQLPKAVKESFPSFASNIKRV